MRVTRNFRRHVRENPEPRENRGMNKALPDGFPGQGLASRARALICGSPTLDVRNSGDTGGRAHRDRVVGYGSWALENAGSARLHR